VEFNVGKIAGRIGVPCVDPSQALASAQRRQRPRFVDGPIK
jgi:hypothetical protein